MCVFCDQRKIKSKVREVDNCLVFEPLNPVTPGHLLVVNKVHTEDFTDNPAIFSLTAMTAAKVAHELGGDYNLITSKGSDATQTVFHCHIHLIPRRKGDGLKLPWTNHSSQNEIDPSLQDSAGIVPSIKDEGSGPKDLNEFLQCLAIDVKGIDDAKRNIIETRNNPNSTVIQRGQSYMWESRSLQDLYELCKSYLHRYL